MLRVAFFRGVITDSRMLDPEEIPPQNLIAMPLGSR
jgi:hypothetical protein